MAEAPSNPKLYETKGFSRLCVGLAVVLVFVLLLGLVLFAVIDVILMRNFTQAAAWFASPQTSTGHRETKARRDARSVASATLGKRRACAM